MNILANPMQSLTATTHVEACVVFWADREEQARSAYSQPKLVSLSQCFHVWGQFLFNTFINDFSAMFIPLVGSSELGVLT